MSGKYNDILESLSQEENRENTSRLLALLEKHQPKIEIDRKFQRTLKEDLITTSKVSSGFFQRIFSYGSLSGVGILCTSCIMAFGFWKLWDTSMPYQKTLEVPIISMMRENIGKNEGDKTISTSSLSFDSGEIPQEGLTRYHEEKKEIDTEIRAISDDIFASIDIPIDAGTPSQIENNPPVSTLMTTDTISMMKMGGVSTEQASSLAVSPLIESYPSIMKVYKKPSAWTEEDILSRSGAEMTTEELPTEKVSIITRKIETTLKDRTVARTYITYKPLSKRIRADYPGFYLVPVIEYTFDTGDTLSIPLIRGFR